MKLVSYKKKLQLYKLTCDDCVQLILSFAFYDVDVYKRQCMKTIKTILNDGYSRTRVYKKFYQMWHDADQDSFWLHVYKENKHTVVLQNENCIRCGNYRTPYPLNKLCDSILCNCGFVEMYSELTY